MAVACAAAVGLLVASVVGVGIWWGLSGAVGGNTGGPGAAAVWAVFALEALFLIPAWRWGPGKHGGGWAALGLRAPHPRRAALSLIVGFPALMLVNVAWGVVAQRFGWARQADVLPLFGSGWPGLAVGLVLGGVVAPFAEEVFFRGYLYAGIRARHGWAWSAAVSAAVFAVFHMQFGVLVPIWAMGAILSGVYEREQSLWTPIALHALTNGVALVAAFAARGA